MRIIIIILSSFLLPCYAIEENHNLVVVSAEARGLEVDNNNKFNVQLIKNYLKNQKFDMDFIYALGISGNHLVILVNSTNKIFHVRPSEKLVSHLVDYNINKITFHNLKYTPLAIENGFKDLIVK